VKILIVKKKETFLDLPGLTNPDEVDKIISLLQPKLLSLNPKSEIKVALFLKYQN